MGEPAGAHRHPAERVRTLVRGLGQSLLTAGLVAVLFVVYELFVTCSTVGGRTPSVNKCVPTRLKTERLDRPRGTRQPSPARSRSGRPSPSCTSRDSVRTYQRVVLEGTAEAQRAQGPGRPCRSIDSSPAERRKRDCANGHVVSQDCR
jgi:sortase A